MKKKIIFLLFLCALISINISCSMKNASSNYQIDADIFRLSHIKYYGELLEEYYKKQGKYPFQTEANIPVYVHIATEFQERYITEAIPYEHKLFTMREFVEELETGLERTVEEYYDPQKVPVAKPNFYIYMINQDTYFFAVHVHKSYTFSKKIAEDYYKVEISNHANESNKSILPEDLFNNKEFIEIINNKSPKESFFLDLQEEYLHHTK